MQFPRQESEIVALAQEMANGLEINAADYPAPPHSPAEIDDATLSYISNRDSATIAKATSEEATVTKDVALDALVSMLKKNLRYAENVTDFNDNKLKQLGWAGRGVRTSLIAPGQPPLLTVTDSGPGDLSLEWRKPQDGGEPASYKIERRLNGEETWSIAGLALDTGTTLTQQPRGDTFEYRVVAVNKAGMSPASNTVAVVL